MVLVKGKRLEWIKEVATTDWRDFPVPVIRQNLLMGIETSALTSVNRFICSILYGVIICYVIPLA